MTIKLDVLYILRQEFLSLDKEGLGVICDDNDPGPNGKIGQIIYLINECDFIVLADSFREFIDLYIDRNAKRTFRI